MKKTDIQIGYYPIRGKAQVCRLLCEYLGVEYKDKLYTITEWEKYKKIKQKSTKIMELPYLEEGNFHITGSIPMCLYIIERFSNGELLGKSLHDQAVIDMYIWTIESLGKIININCQKKSEQEIEAFKEVQWTNVVYPKLKKYEDHAHPEGWFMGYLTIIDFSIYELVRYMNHIFGEKNAQLEELQRITKMVGELPQIKAYENSNRCLHEMCPTTLLKMAKEEIIKKKSKRENNDNESQSHSQSQSQSH